MIFQALTNLKVEQKAKNAPLPNKNTSKFWKGLQKNQAKKKF